MAQARLGQHDSGRYTSAAPDHAHDLAILGSSNWNCWSDLDSIPVPFDITRVPNTSRYYHGAKRALDVVVAVLLLLALLPVLLLIGLAVKLDSPGPVLFRQPRIGRYGRPFHMLKFRTMRADRRTRPGQPPPGMPERRRAHKTAHDPRITPLGRFLRRTSLDELPQLWNVLRGEMSLVGPRPELPEIVGQYQPWQHLRHLVTPGITGWWQVSRDGTCLMHEATELDLYYVYHQSLKLDFLILARTLGAVVRGRVAM